MEENFSTGEISMWDLNDYPGEQQQNRRDHGGCSEEEDKGKRVGSISNSSSSAMVIEDRGREESSDYEGMKKRRSGKQSNSNSSKIFGFSVYTENHEDQNNYSSSESTGGEQQPMVFTRQFFPVEESSEMETSFPRAAHWVGVKFCESSEPATPVAVAGSSKQSLSVMAEAAAAAAAAQPIKKSRRGPRSRSSQYRGVTFYRRTGRWESHIWDCGKQVYLGGFDTAHAAARAYDRAAIKFRGVEADINFTLNDYEDDLKQMNNLTKEEFVHVLRRQSTGFPRGSSKYRGVTLHKCGRWEARMGQFLGKKYVYLGLFDSEIEAASCYEIDPRIYDTELNPSGNNKDENLDLCLGSSASTSTSRSDNRWTGNDQPPPESVFEHSFRLKLRDDKCRLNNNDPRMNIQSPSSLNNAHEMQRYEQHFRRLGETPMNTHLHQPLIPPYFQLPSSSTNGVGRNSVGGGPLRTTTTTDHEQLQRQSRRVHQYPKCSQVPSLQHHQDSHR